MQSPNYWGSKLWTLLHAVGTRTGRSLGRLRHDELRELQWMVANLETIVPCQECRKHIDEYRRHMPPPSDAGETAGYNFWFWNFHEAVNHRLGKEGITFETLMSLKQVGVFEAWKEFTRVVRIPSLILKNFERHLRLWAGFAGI